MTEKVFCRLADCVNWDSGLCSADEIRIDREGYCATYEEIPEEATDKLDLVDNADELEWEDEEEELDIQELGEGEWTLDEDEDEDEDEDMIEDDPWSL